MGNDNEINEFMPLREVVFLTLRKAILKGELQPGERLMEIQLANKLGVSRTPIREAIRMLEHEGLVVMKPRRGAQVAKITVQELDDVLEVRKSLEMLAIHKACERMTEEDMQAEGADKRDLDGIVAEMRYALHAETATVEFGLSVGDRWQGHGIASALLKNLECRAAALRAEHVVGDTLRSNEAMVSLARKSGFAFVNHPDDWKLVRFDKEISVAPQDIPCASWRLAALSRQAESPSATA